MFYFWTLFGNLDFIACVDWLIDWLHWLIEVFDAYILVVNIAIHGLVDWLKCLMQLEAYIDVNIAMHWMENLGLVYTKQRRRTNSNCLDNFQMRTRPILFYLQQSQLTTSPTLENSEFHIFARISWTVLFVSCVKEMFIPARLNVFQDMYQDLGISIQFLVQINTTVSHKRYLRTNTKR